MLFSAIEDSLIGTSGSQLIQSIFHGSTVNQVTCLSCQFVSERNEDFLDIQVPLQDVNNVEDALDMIYMETESLSGDNQYRCSNCGNMVDATKVTNLIAYGSIQLRFQGSRIKVLPPILTLSLLRFAFDMRKLERYKDDKKFVFPTRLNMKKYLVDNGPEQDCLEYELYSLVIHGYVTLFNV